MGNQSKKFVNQKLIECKEIQVTMEVIQHYLKWIAHSQCESTWETLYLETIFPIIHKLSRKNLWIKVVSKQAGSKFFKITRVASRLSHQSTMFLIIYYWNKKEIPL